MKSPTCEPCARVAESLKPIVQASHIPPRIFQSNDPLEDQIQRDVLREISTAVTEQQKCQNEIVRLEGLLSGLKEKDDALSKHIRALKGTVSPIRRMPVELLREIFAIVVHTTLPRNYMHEFRTCLQQFHPWSIALVCRRWTQVSLSVPGLCTFKLDLNTSHERCCLKPLRDRIRHFFAASGQHPIALDIHHRVVDEDDFLEDYDDYSDYEEVLMERRARHRSLAEEYSSSVYAEGVLDAFIDNSHRWADASFHLSDDPMEALHAIREKIPQLKKLAINAEWSGYCCADLSVFEIAPALTEVSLRHISPSDLKLPWSQVEVLSFQATSTTPKAILPTLSSLRTLRIMGSSIQGFHAPAASHTEPQPNSLTLPLLQELKCDISVASVLNFLKLPRLKKLELSGIIYPETVPALLNDTSSSLQSLYVTMSDNPLHLLPLLRHSRSVVNFSLSNSRSCSSLFRALTYCPDRECLLPLLQSLSVGGEQICKDFVALVKSRTLTGEGGSHTSAPSRLLLVRVTKASLFYVDPVARDLELAKLDRVKVVIH
ncbi:hypothetical protein HGRIS_007089 [Hohenbuehelia grisea]|uniref:F-box domain-containing protein n=1 Tax=Hohenbuehelia grisea TaxID=104357 RepID=A0ABR3JCN0_9AGAR